MGGTQLQVHMGTVVKEWSWTWVEDPGVLHGRSESKDVRCVSLGMATRTRERRAGPRLVCQLKAYLYHDTRMNLEVQ